nr:hypothetical protein Itr_chr04CG01550 [Ipomoea trifida]
MSYWRRGSVSVSRKTSSLPWRTAWMNGFGSGGKNGRAAGRRANMDSVDYNKDGSMEDLLSREKTGVRHVEYGGSDAECKLPDKSTRCRLVMKVKYGGVR